MTHLKLAATLLLIGLTQACALDAQGEQSSASSVAADRPPLADSGIPAPRCERLDDLGLAATGILLHESNPMAEQAPCLSLEGGRLASFAGRTCRLVEPESFSLVGCVDTYDCGGCGVELRDDESYGFVARGTSDSPECGDLAAKYALVPGQVCNAKLDHR